MPEYTTIKEARLAAELEGKTYAEILHDAAIHIARAHERRSDTNGVALAASYAAESMALTNFVMAKILLDGTQLQVPSQLEETVQENVAADQDASQTAERALGTEAGWDPGPPLGKGHPK